LTPETTTTQTTSAVQTGVVALFLLAILISSLLIQTATGSTQAVLFVIGIGFGIVLLHALFGFTGGWRRFIRQRDSRPVRAHLLLLMLTAFLFFPLLGNAFPTIHVSGAISPVGYSVLVGAFLFGIGMQLGGGCGSGTLYTFGQGQMDMLLTLIFFIVGATVGSAHLPWWLALGDLGTISIIQQFGWIPALLLTLAVLGFLYVITQQFDRKKNGEVKSLFAGTREPWLQTLLFGRWPLWWAVIALAILNLATMLVAGHPWSITFAFGLWGTKIWSALGGDISQWQYWQSAYPAIALNSSVLNDVTSVMDLGLILGAGLAAALAGRFAPPTQFSASKWLAVVVGGLCLGYGARLAFGCNIGALVAGISSGSAHGWLWLGSGFIGNILGSQLRYWIKLDKV
jgi:uncharacterized membrane protein YedE/YeeE